MLSHLLECDPPTYLISVNLHFKGNVIGVFKTLSESTGFSSDMTETARGFFEELIVLLLDGEGYS